MSQVYFVSDTHFGHKNICKFRPKFSSVIEHDETIFDNIMSTGSKRDTLWMLGDLFFTDESMSKFDAINNYFNCVNIIFGNHCTEGKGKARSKYIANHCNRFGSMFKYNGFWLTHAPIHADELRGKLNIHGHTHNHVVDDERYINVCMENIDYKPISFDEIKEKQ